MREWEKLWYNHIPEKLIESETFRIWGAFLDQQTWRWAQQTEYIGQR